MRSRIFADNTTSVSYRARWTTVPVLPDQTDRLDIVSRIVRRDEMVDVVTPKFSSIRNKGGIICSPMYRESLYYCQDRTTIEKKGRLNGIAITHNYHWSDLLGGSEVSKLAVGTYAMDEYYKEFASEVDLAVTRAHAEVDVSEMQLLASLGELPETLAWLQSLVSRGLKLTRAFQKKAQTASVLRTLKYAFEEADGLSAKGRKRLVRRYESYVELLKKRKERFKANTPSTTLVDDFSGLWLEYRYALRPLISDMQNAIKALAKILDDKRYTARGHEYSVGKSESIVRSTYSGQSEDVEFVARVQRDFSIKARSGVLYCLETELLSMFEILGLDQPVEALYELIPFSFILDWFFSVGDMIQSWCKSSGLNVLTSWVTLLEERTVDTKIISANVLNKNGYIWYPNQTIVLGSSFLVVSRKWRKPNPELPILPRFDLKLNLAKIIDLGMIGRALLGGSVPAVSKRS